MLSSALTDATEISTRPIANSTTTSLQSLPLTKPIHYKSNQQQLHVTNPPNINSSRDSYAQLQQYSNLLSNYNNTSSPIKNPDSSPNKSITSNNFIGINSTPNPPIFNKNSNHNNTENSASFNPNLNYTNDRSLTPIDDLLQTENEKYKLRHDETHEELLQKYNILKKDYSKYKNLTSILKKGANEERDKSRLLSQTIAEKDHEIYILMSEQDKLTMLNSSYKSRLEKILKENEEMQNNPQNINANNSVVGNFLTGSSNTVTPQQMQAYVTRIKALKKEATNRAEENENLIIQVNELKSAHRYSTEIFEKKILDLKAQLNKNFEVINGLEFEKKQFEKHLKGEIERRDQQILHLEKQLKDQDSRFNLDTFQLKKDYTSVNNKFNFLMSKLENSNPFDSYKNPNLSQFNLPLYAKIPSQRYLQISNGLHEIFSNVLTKFNAISCPLLLKLFFPKWLQYSSTSPTHNELSRVLESISRKSLPISNFLLQIRCIVEKTNSIDDFQSDVPSYNANLLWSYLYNQDEEGDNFSIRSYTCFDQISALMQSLIGNPFGILNVDTWASTIDRLLQLLFEWFKSHVTMLEVWLGPTVPMSKIEKNCLDCFSFLISSYSSLLTALSDGMDNWKFITKPLLNAIRMININKDLEGDATTFLLNPIIIAWFKSPININTQLKPVNLSDSESYEYTCIDYIISYFSNVQKGIRSVSSRFIALCSVEASLPLISPFRTSINRTIIYELNGIGNILTQTEEFLMAYKDLLVLNDHNSAMNLDLFKSNTLLPIRQFNSVDLLADRFHLHQLHNDLKQKACGFLFNKLTLSPPEIKSSVDTEIFNQKCTELVLLRETNEKLNKECSLVKSYLYNEKSRMFEQNSKLSVAESNYKQLSDNLKSTSNLLSNVVKENKRLENLCKLSSKSIQQVLGLKVEDNYFARDWSKQVKEQILSLTHDIENTDNKTIAETQFHKVVSIFLLLLSNCTTSMTSSPYATSTVVEKNLIKSANQITKHYGGSFYKMSVKYPKMDVPDKNVVSSQVINSSVWSSFRMKCNNDIKASINNALLDGKRRLFDYERVISMWKHEVNQLESNAVSKQALLSLADVDIEQYKTLSTRLEEELVNSRNSYKDMLSELTEHICELTEKLVQAGVQPPPRLNHQLDTSRDDGGSVKNNY